MEPAPRTTDGLRDVEFDVPGELAGATLAAVVRSALGEFPWSRCRALIESGRVRVDGRPSFEPALRMTPGVRVEIHPLGPRVDSRLLPEERIIFLDHEIVVVDKPAGLVSVPYDDSERDSLLARTREAIRGLGERAHGGDRFHGLGVVQRLDKETTGLIVFARTRRARQHLESQLRAHTITRRYLAIAHGNVRPGTHTSDLVADRGDGLRGSWRSRGGSAPRQARRAITHVRVEERLHGATLVACMLETGRQHQIRIHLSEAGNPLVGERVYIRGFRERPIDAPRPMLHAATLGFRHPAHDRPVSFELPIPDDFRAMLERLR